MPPPQASPQSSMHPHAPPRTTAPAPACVLLLQLHDYTTHRNRKGLLCCDYSLQRSELGLSSISSSMLLCYMLTSNMLTPLARGGRVKEVLDVSKYRGTGLVVARELSSQSTTKNIFSSETENSESTKCYQTSGCSFSLAQTAARELLFIRWSDHDEGTAAVGRGIAQPVAFNRQGSRRIKRTKLNSFVKQRASTAIDNPRLFVFGVLRVVVFRVTASSFTFIIHHHNKDKRTMMSRNQAAKAQGNRRALRVSLCSIICRLPSSPRCLNR